MHGSLTHDLYEVVTPIPAKLREAILRARADGFSYDEIASMLGVGYATVNRILRLHRETNAVEPRPRGGGNVSPIHGKIEALLRSIVEEMPDATVAELTATLMAKSKTTTSRSGVQRALARLGFSRKKSRSLPWSATHPKAARAAAASARS